MIAPINESALQAGDVSAIRLCHVAFGSIATETRCLPSRPLFPIADIRRRDGRTSPLPKLETAGMEERMKRAQTLAAKYHTELLKP
jgi:hypothetical protein